MDLEKINQRVEARWRQRIADEAGETPEAGAGENGHGGELVRRQHSATEAQGRPVTE